MKRYRLTFDAMVFGMLDRRRISAIRSARDQNAAIATLATDYSDITNLLVEVL